MSLSDFWFIRVPLITLSGSTVMLTCTHTALSSSRFLIDSRLSSAAGQVGVFCKTGMFHQFPCETLLLFLQAVMLSLKSSTAYVSICAVIHRSGWSLVPPVAVCSPAIPSSLTISKDKQNQKVSLFQIVSLHSLTVQQHWCVRMSINCL